MSYSYPQYPLQKFGSPGGYNTRSFKAGEPVGVRNGYATSGTYVQPLTQPGTGYTYGHVVRSNVPGYGPSNRHVGYEHIGKMHQPVSATAAGFVAQHTGLPANIGRLISRYGGRSRRRRTQKKLKSRRRSRHN